MKIEAQPGPDGTLKWKIKQLPPPPPFWVGLMYTWRSWPLMMMVIVAFTG